MKRFLALFFALALVASACGSDDDTSTSSSGDDDVVAASSSDDDSSSSSDDTAAAPTTTEKEEEQLVFSKGELKEEAAKVVGVTQTADPLGPRGPEPRGTLDYGWHSSFSPKYFDPSGNPAASSPYATQYIIHDAMVKNTPTRNFAPSLAEEYTIAEDFMSASFTLREGLTFHDGTPITTKDVEWTYMNYSGASAQVLHDMLDRTEIVDERTIIFHFNAPFLDFLLLYGTTSSGAGWILPSDYYQEVGKEGFAENPIGAGPYKFVKNDNNLKITYEAFTDYWRKNPGVKTINWHAIKDAATRVAAIKSGEIDMANVIPGTLLEAVRSDPNLQTISSSNVSFWLEFIGYDNPDNPFNDIRVREAAFLALNRVAINEMQSGGGGDSVGQWIPTGYNGVIDLTEDDVYQDVERAKELMVEAGYADGFDGGQITPLPNYFAMGERIISDLNEIGIRLTLNQMERGAFLGEINAGRDGTLTGVLVNISGAGGDAASRVRTFATCDGSASRICDKFIDLAFEQYQTSTDPDERTELIEAIQRHILDQHIFPYVYTVGHTMVQGTDVVEDAGEIWGQIPQYIYPGLWEDIHVK
ncbi:MAG: ABC transporter substrate-binding protein [Actinomycetota bacterium]|nr:hypothetical protein [Acidimicrobiaceae bacterium]MCH2625780.1 ABC transporter substrate-binding protein [Acidimicrobiales bacterium]MEC7874923.1 ABC transporter substrate-binding protein [Actinomycetota bacterium]